MIRTGIIIKAQVSAITRRMPVLYDGTPAEINEDLNAVRLLPNRQIRSFQEDTFSKLTYLAIASPVPVDLLDSRDDQIYFSDDTFDFRKNIALNPKQWSTILRFDLIGSEVDFVVDHYSYNHFDRGGPHAHMLYHHRRMYSPKEVQLLMNKAYNLGQRNEPMLSKKEWYEFEH